MADKQSVGIAITSPVSAEAIISALAKNGITSLEELAEKMSSESNSFDDSTPRVGYVVKVVRIDNVY